MRARLACALLCVIAASGCTRSLADATPSSPLPEPWPPVKGEPYPDIELRNHAGETVQLSSFRGKVNGNPVAIVPERAKLFVAGDGDVLCLERLLDMAEREYAASRRSISPAMYTVDDTGAVIPLALPDKHPLRNPVALGHARLALAEYDIQQKVLQKDREEDVFVASYVAVQREDGTITSYSTWTDGVPTWLPKTDDVALVGGNPEDPTVLRVPWEAMEGMLRELPDVYPPRFETGDWPDAADLEKLRAVAL